MFPYTSGVGLSLNDLDVPVRVAVFTAVLLTFAIGLMWLMTRTYTKKANSALAGVPQLVGGSSCKPKGCRFNPWLGHIPRLWVRSCREAYKKAAKRCFSH